MSLNREYSSVEGQKASVLIRLGARVLGTLGSLGSVLVAALCNEKARAGHTQTTNEDEDILLNLPEQPHMAPGEMKYGSGIHKYF